MDGTVIKDTFLLIPKDPAASTSTIDSVSNKLKDCCGAFSLKALADISSSDEFKNDKAGILFWFDPIISSATMELLKWNGSEYEHEDDLNNDDYGTFYDYGFFINNSGEKFIGYQIEWRKVLTEFGEGSYKIRCSVVSSLAGNSDYDSQEYCLKQYSTFRAEGTVRTEYYMSGIYGFIDNDEKIKDFGSLNWYNSFRLPGFFGFPTTPFKTEYVAYNNGQRLFVEDDQEPEYILKLKPVSYFIHETMRIDILMADKILITDYNSKNPGSFIKKSVQKAGEYSPTWNKLKSKLAGVEIKLRQEFNNLKKFRD